MDLISIILPYYKKKYFINKTIKSILIQTHQKFELLIIYDDEDKDDLIYIKRLIKKNPRIKFIVNKRNLGVSKSRNKGIVESKGKYICFIDADDIWKKNKLKIQLDFIKKNKCYLCHSNYKIINKNDKTIGLMKVKKILEYKDLIYSCDIGLSTVMINSKLKSKIIFPNMKTKEDFILWLKLSKKFKFYGIQKDLVYWRKGKTSKDYIIQKIKDAFTLYSKYEKFNIFKSSLFVLILSFNFFKKSFIQKIS
tara:strand:- start:1074 stop:1826 length:753 start_codon:yes stop_codon:yes gene_type:complete